MKNDDHTRAFRSALHRAMSPEFRKLVELAVRAGYDYVLFDRDA